VGGAYFWLRGTVDHKSSLFEALLLYLAPMAEVWGNTPNDDLPCWVAKQPPLARKRNVEGIRDLFTFQSRCLQLVPDANDRITGVRYNQGSKIDKLLFHDPHLAYRANKEGVFPLRFNTAHALWQDSAVFMMTLTKKGEGGHAPRTFEWLSSFRDTLGLDRRVAFSADVFGMVNDQAKVELWRHERVTIYPDILTDGARWHALNELITKAQCQANRLRDATRAFARRSRLNKPWGIPLSDGERKDMDAFARALDTGSRYWPALGQDFPDFLHQIATAALNSLGAVEERWKQVLRQTALKALRQVLDCYPLSHSSWQAITEAETILRTGTLNAVSIKTPSA
jgi:CRISPR system Cascade subunit CasA